LRRSHTDAEIFESYSPLQKPKQVIAAKSVATSEPQLDLVKPELFFQLREYGEDRLPVCIVEKADEPEHKDDPPLVAGCNRDIRFLIHCA